MYEPGLDYFVDKEREAIWWWRGWIPPFIGGREDGGGGERGYRVDIGAEVSIGVFHSRHSSV